MSTAHARHTDPETSHEAAATIDPNRSQAAVLRLLHEYQGDYFTHKGVVATYQRVQQSTLEALYSSTVLPQLSESRIRTACNELHRLGVLVHVGYTRPPSGTRRERIWRLAEEWVR